MSINVTNVQLIRIVKGRFGLNALLTKTNPLCMGTMGYRQKLFGPSKKPSAIYLIAFPLELYIRMKLSSTFFLFFSTDHVLFGQNINNQINRISMF